MRKSLYTFLLSFSIVAVSNGQSASCNNEDFEIAGLTNPVPSTIACTTTTDIPGWTCSRYVSSTGGLTFACSFTACCPSPPLRIHLIAPGPTGHIDPAVGSSYPIYSVFGDSLNIAATSSQGFPSFGDWFVRVHNLGSSFTQERLSKTFTVTPANAKFKFAFLPVVPISTHCCCDNGAAHINFEDCFGNTLTTTQYKLAGDQDAGCTGGAKPCITPATLTLTPSTTLFNYGYTKWNIDSVDLSPWMGLCVKVNITGNDCGFGAHPGYIYFDAKCNTESPTGINLENNILGIKIYPNPNSGNFNIDVAKEINNGEIELRNILGQVVHKQNIKQGNNQIKTENLAKGIYSYSILQDKEVLSVGKIVID